MPERIPDDASYPEWARGKSIAEALRLGDAAYKTALAYAGASPQPAPQREAPAAPPSAPLQIEDDGYVTGAHLRSFAESASQRFVPQVNAAVELAASGNLGLARQRHAETFAKYGPEIMARLQSVPKASWTLDNLETVVKLSLVDHLDEVAGERASRLAANMTPTMRSTGDAGSGSVPEMNKSRLEADKIPIAWRNRAKQAGIDERTVQEFCYRNEMSEDEFFAQFGAGLVTDAVTEVSIKRSA